ncbi:MULTISPECIES: c-type cytochrome biogenesis protein CcsB [Acidithiobacillus]|jgi:cytochrome c-type biogenesis protein CcsB|uniref:Cytochrome c-type biogenesis protein CcsA/ResC n=2 Tax=Acidithiobacillus caldus TaxID=33059 RepID=A0A059ZWR2_ACICK|nr:MULTISPECIES: c-type cytochrome biogenesis protein CcsB [Acidithiobacillus]AIA56015.1 Cytochrome c-type biogenesis protein CcsA/ResC [Acidithiobacillus caldus ATCC 51756]AUW33368.1 c-type cytochrome biogenesis protein CcsB [Acidithiobacillus caldus]MBU2728785.1 c-type cytochrome biogenesis protein CcsB [Acidithiobacillus caldus]MBU2736163.1 c-type cytochrome biogenesis protein CcsB [Acidithiobacillus caldus ATCC 51756]MBU2745503.1 c-type cytochrome biogenesis protein CcsB [Acidithiobacillus
MSVQTQEPALTPTAPRRFHWGWPELGWLTFLTLGALTVWSIFRAQFWLWQYIILALWYVGLLWFGLKWPHFRSLTLSVLAIAGIGVGLYGAGLNPHNSLILRYGFQSNAMFVWMSVAIALSAMGYYGYLFRGARLAGIWGQRFAWVASTLGFAGLAIRWRETYLGHPSWGHIPVSNIYDVMVLFCAMTILFYLYHEEDTDSRGLGAFVLPLVLVADVFLLWVGAAYHLDRIQPLIPALQSFWMKIHVPSMFVAYANFYISAMAALAWLLKDRGEAKGSVLARRLPSRELLERTFTGTISFGFLFFTVGTILGAVWAARAWGGFWSWDPKETWALIVWLNYAGFLHARSQKNWHGRPMAWWAFTSLIVVTFCFIGVDLFLGGLHSYGKL